MGDREKSGSAWLMLLLVFGGLALPGALPSRRATGTLAGREGGATAADSTSASDEDSKAGGEDASSSDLVTRSVLDLIDEAINNVEHETPSNDPKSPREPRPADDAAHWSELSNSVARVKTDSLEVSFLIATLPDPVDSHSLVAFDGALTAIQWAMSKNGFVLDRYWLPWSAWLAHKGKDVLPRDYHRHPGVMLFRHLDAAPTKQQEAKPQAAVKSRFLALLVVGETPTSGVHKVALAECFDIAAAWHAPNVDDDVRDLEVPVLGPSFSGSARSMRLCAEQWMRRHKRIGSPFAARAQINFCSGSATARSNQSWLRREPTDDCPLKLTFTATVYPDDVSVETILNYFVSDRNIPPDQIVMLTEVGTAYADQIDFKSHEVLHKIVQLVFPMQIGRLRSEYDKVPDLKYGPLASPSPVPRTGLGLAADDARFAIDVPPTYSEETTRAAERQLDAILSTISRRDVRVVGIVATDINDTLFLAQQVRRYAPDVQLFTGDGNLLFANADYLQYTDGMLCVSSYPLFPNNQYWLGDPDPELLTFPSSAAEGEYNAATVLLTKLLKPSRAKRAKLRDYRTPFESGQKPPLWLMIVGRDGLWPIVTWNQVDDRRYVHVDKPPREVVFNAPPVDAPSGIYATLAALVSLACVFLWFARNRPGDGAATGGGATAGGTTPGLPWYAAVWAPFAPMPRPRQTTAACGAAAVFFVGLLLIQLGYSAPLWQLLIASIAARQSLSQDSVAELIWVHGMSGVATLALAAVMFALCFEWVRQYCASRVRVKQWLLATLVVIAVVVATAIWWWPSGSSSNRSLDAAIFAERLGTYSSGVSPLISASLLGAIISLWGICHLRRLHFLNYFEVCSPFGAEGDLPAVGNEHVAGIDSRIRALGGPLERVWFRPQRFLDYAFLVFVGLAFAYVFLVRWSGTVEGRLFDWFYVATAGVAVAAIALLHVRMTATSGLFERLLRRLGQHPLAASFDRIPQRLASKAGGNVLSAAPHPGDYELSVRLLKQIQEQCASSDAEKIPKPLKQAVNKYSASTEALLSRLMSVERPERLKAFEYAASLNRELALVSQALVANLEKYWSECTIRPAPPAGDAPPQSEPGLKSTWQENAELLVSLQLTHLMRQVFAQIQNMLTFLVGMTLLLLWALNSYPFQPQRLLMLFSYVLVIWMIATTLVIFVKFNRDDVLSRLAGSTPNQFTWDRSVVLALVTYVVIPALSLLAVQFPEVSQTLFSWIGYVQRALHG